MTQFNWHIDSLPVYTRKDGKTNVVSEISWRCDAIEEDSIASFSASIDGIVTIHLDHELSFVDYENLTEDIVWEWVYAKVNKEIIEENLQLAIDSKRTSKPVTLPLPWIS